MAAEQADTIIVIPDHVARVLFAFAARRPVRTLLVVVLAARAHGSVWRAVPTLCDGWLRAAGDGRASMRETCVSLGRRSTRMRTTQQRGAAGPQRTSSHTLCTTFPSLMGATCIHLVALHLTPARTGQPPCREPLSSAPLLASDQKSSTSPLRGFTAGPCCAQGDHPVGSSPSFGPFGKTVSPPSSTSLR